MSMCRFLNTDRMKKNQFVFMSKVFLIHSGQKEGTTKFFTVRGCSSCLSAVEKIVNRKFYQVQLKYSSLRFSFLADSMMVQILM